VNQSVIATTLTNHFDYKPMSKTIQREKSGFGCCSLFTWDSVEPTTIRREENDSDEG
jgi:hypothetical protein